MQCSCDQLPATTYHLEEMNIVDVGNGAPLVLIPGIQGRWEWMRPAVDVLAKHCRVITFSLADEPTSGARFDESSGIWGYVQQVDDVMDAAGVRAATICGVSFGGLIASSFAARHAAKVSGWCWPPRFRRPGGPTPAPSSSCERRGSCRRCSASARCGCVPRSCGERLMVRRRVRRTAREHRAGEHVLAAPDGAPRRDGDLARRRAAAGRRPLSSPNGDW